MMNYFIFNNENSLDDYGLYFETLPVLPLASMSETNNPQITCTLGFETNKDKILKIRKWLAVKEGRLSFSYDDRVFVVTNIIASEYNKNKTFTVINIIFEVEKYCPIENYPIIIENNFNEISIFNEGNFTSLPLISIEGEGNITLQINETVQCVVENVSGIVTIDSEIQECYLGTADDIVAIKNRDFYGEFPLLMTGLNRVSIDSTTNKLSKVIIEPRWIL